MNRNELVKSVENLPEVSKECVAEYSSKMDMLVDQMNQKMSERVDCIDLVGENNLQMMKDNHANHARFMESIFVRHSPEILTDTVIWVFRAYRSRKFSSAYWAAQLNTWIELYRTELSPECFSAIYPYYLWMQINIPFFNSLAENDPEENHSAH